MGVELFLCLSGMMANAGANRRRFSELERMKTMKNESNKQETDAPASEWSDLLNEAAAREIVFR